MRTLIAAAVVAISATAVQAKDMKSCAAEWQAQKKAGTTWSQTYKQFSATCMAAGKPGDTGLKPPAPQAAAASPPAKTAAPAQPATAGAAPAGATAQCKDNSYSTSKHHSGTCSRHGGVAKFLQ